MQNEKDHLNHYNEFEHILDFEILYESCSFSIGSFHIIPTYINVCIP